MKKERADILAHQQGLARRENKLNARLWSGKSMMS